MDGMERWKRLGLVRVAEAGVESIGEKGRSQMSGVRWQACSTGPSEAKSEAAGRGVRDQCGREPHPSVAGAGAAGAKVRNRLVVQEAYHGRVSGAGEVETGY